MAVTARIYGKMFLSAFNAEIDWVTETMKVALTTAEITTSDQDTDDYFNDITEISGTGYLAGGATLATRTQTYTGGTNTFILDADNVTTDWTTSTLSARSAIVYNSSPSTNATRPLICYVDAGATISTTAGNFSILWHADGIVKIVVA